MSSYCMTCGRNFDFERGSAGEKKHRRTKTHRAKEAAYVRARVRGANRRLRQR